MAADVNFKRGDFVLAAGAGDYGKVRPNLVIQSDAFLGMPSVTVCPLTSDLRNDVPLIRIDVDPNAKNGLQLPSQIAIDKITTIPVSRLAKTIGAADEDVMLQVTRALAVFLGVG